MRYGLIACGLPDLPEREQRAVLERARATVLLKAFAGGGAEARKLEDQLFALRAGDELVVQDLSAFLRETDSLIRLLGDLMEIGVVVILASEDGSCTELSGSGATALLRALRGLANIPTRSEQPGRRRFSVFQIDYARRLYDEGRSLRFIGMIFQASPDEIWKVVNR
ncbi:hypothetical protein [Caulobacter sp. NIBR2454]|uniref:hypothetical protein n=1 Tax=Caulobacter sp. NIBR2454 TaxID=3015996 RepID=UPI0022B6F337|nr:hypothetical protein [Caulobacter sp. NIBR2454]